MANQVAATFIIDCPYCRAKVAAQEKGRAEWYQPDPEGDPFGHRVLLGNCPQCENVLVGQTDQIGFENLNAYEDEWSDIIRVFPRPAKVFSSARIPQIVTDSLGEAERTLQAGAYIATCAMLGRALEALCRDVLQAGPKNPDPPTELAKAVKPLMLGSGIKQLYEAKVIDERLYKWSQQLKAFRDLAAHPEDIHVSREDAGDLQTFVNAIVEYVYDLADRYVEFTGRTEARAKRKQT